MVLAVFKKVPLSATHRSFARLVSGKPLLDAHHSFTLIGCFSSPVMRRLYALRKSTRHLSKMIALSNSSCLSETTLSSHRLFLSPSVLNKSLVFTECPPSWHRSPAITSRNGLFCRGGFTLKQNSYFFSTLETAHICETIGFDGRKRNRGNQFSVTTRDTVKITHVGEMGGFSEENHVRRKIVNLNRCFPLWNNFRPCVRCETESLVPRVSASIDLFSGKALRLSRNAALCEGIGASHFNTLAVPAVGRDSASTRRTMSRISPLLRAGAEEALLDYLHYTRGLQFTDADHMSKNCQEFIKRLLSKVEPEEEVKRSLVRFLRYHPINEFEPFFESIGLKPEEFSPLLQQDLMFLCDSPLLIENYHVLCNYGIPRSKLGRVYLDAREIFGYDYGVLKLKIRAYEMLGLNSYTLIKIIMSCPLLLVGDVDANFKKVLEELKAMEIEYERIGESLCEKNSYEWGKILHLLKRLQEFGCSRKELAGLIKKHGAFLFDSSGSKTYLLIALFLKSGFRMSEILDMFFQSPEIVAGNFVKNFWQGIHFLNYLEMERENIAKIIQSHPRLLGSFCLKKAEALMTDLNAGRKRLRSIILEDPNRLKGWVKGKKVRPLPGTGEEEKARQQKIEFLLRLGYQENSDELEKAFKRFRGRGDELQERFDFLVKAGINCHDVAKMVKLSPPVLNQSTDVIAEKIDIVVNRLNYPLKTIVSFPSILCYDPQRIRIRLSMYNWLIERGFARPMLAMSTIFACSDERFMKHFVNNHPEGPQVWEKLKNSSASC